MARSREKLGLAVASEIFVAVTGVVLGCTHPTSLFNDGVLFCSARSSSD